MIRVVYMTKVNKLSTNSQILKNIQIVYFELKFLRYFLNDIMEGIA